MYNLAIRAGEDSFRRCDVCEGRARYPLRVTSDESNVMQRCLHRRRLTMDVCSNWCLPSLPPLTTDVHISQSPHRHPLREARAEWRDVTEPYPVLLWIRECTSPPLLAPRLKIYYSAVNGTPDPLNQRQTCYHLSHRGKTWISTKILNVEYTVTNSELLRDTIYFIIFKQCPLTSVQWTKIIK